MTLKLPVLAGTITLKVPSALTFTTLSTPPMVTVTWVPLKSAPLVAVPLARVSVSVVGVLAMLVSPTAKLLAFPSTTVSPTMVATFGASSLSTMVPVAVLPPTVRVMVSFASSMVSSVVGKLTVKLVTPAGTL
ncbi:MAG: hypothetical protein ACRCR1_06930, partial [Aeromonas sp.]